MEASPVAIAAEVARIKTEIETSLAAIDGTSTAERVAAFEQALDEAVAAGDAARIKAAAASLLSARAGTDEASTARSIAESQLRGLYSALAAAEKAQRDEEIEVLKVRKVRLHDATVKAFREYAALIDEVSEKYLRLSLVGQEYNRIEAQVRGVPQVNHLPVAPYVEITPPGGYVPCLNEADRKKRFIRELVVNQPPTFAGEQRPWLQRELVERIRDEVAGL